MTPSGWHDDASTDAGHDQMQSDYIACMKMQIGKMSVVAKRLRSEPETVYLTRITAEYPIIKPGYGPIAFVDVALIFGGGKSRPFFRFVELKPKIISVGGLIRQCRTIAELTPENIDCQVVACVFDDDQKLEMLRLAYPNVEVMPGHLRAHR